VRRCSACLCPARAIAARERALTPPRRRCSPGLTELQHLDAMPELRCLYVQQNLLKDLSGALCCHSLAEHHPRRARRLVP
jgi:hypothetical protein